MPVLSTIWSGIKSIISGGVKIVVGVGQAAWALLKFACKAALWVVAGVFEMAKAGYEYICRTVSKIFKPTESIILGKRQLKGLGDYINAQIEQGNADVDEEPIYVDMRNRCYEASDKDEILIVAKGKDDSNEDVLAEPQFVVADGYEERIRNADESGSVYVKRVRVAS